MRYLLLLNLFLMFELECFFVRQSTLDAQLEVNKQQAETITNLENDVKSSNAKIVQLENESTSQKADYQAQLQAIKKERDDLLVQVDNKKNRKNSFAECLKDEPQGRHAIADWLNSINIGSFFDYTNKYLPHSETCFVFNSFENYSAWIEPYGFYSNYHGQKKLDVNLSTIGTHGGVTYLLQDDIQVGGAMGYFHSSYHGTKINSFYIGPSAAYKYKEGHVGFSLFTIKNSYTEGSSWDLNARVEAEYGLKAPQEFLFYPRVRFDYLNVFVSDTFSFLYSNLAMRSEKRILCKEEGYLTAALDIGWINMLPLTAGSATCNKKERVSLKTETKNQLGIGIKLIGMHLSGLLIGVEYDAAIGANAPIQTGRARFEWNW